MQALRLPANRGWHWLTIGLAIFRKRPAQLSFLVMSYSILMLVLSTFPTIGELFTALLVPPFSVSLMIACRNIETNQLIMPAHFFSGFKKNLKFLFILGAIYFILGTLVFHISDLFNEGTLFLRGTENEPELVGLTELKLPEYFIIVSICLINMTYWFSPVLSAWHNLPPAKALFFSFIACALNWRAFLVYFAALTATGVMFGLAINLFSGTLVNDFMVITMISLFLFILLPVIYASFYASYREIFVITQKNT